MSPPAHAGAAEQCVWDIAEGMPTIIQDGSIRYITGPSGLPIEQVDGSGTIEYYIQDQLGSTRGLLDSAGTVVGSYTFTPYGELKGHSGASTPFGYAGQYTDSESGLQYLRARYYDPQSAQFLTVDPLVGSTMESYGYAGGNPANWADPTGLITVGVCFGASFSWAVHVSAHVCAQLAIKDVHTAPQVGITGTVGGGSGTPTVGFGLSAQYSDAIGIEQLGGPFFYAGGHVGAVSFDAFTGQDACSRSVNGGQIGVGPSIPFADFHGGLSYTSARVLRGLNGAAHHVCAPPAEPVSTPVFSLPGAVPGSHGTEATLPSTADGCVQHG